VNRQILIVVAVLLAPVFAAADDAALQQLDSARALWLAADITDYRYTYQRYCVCYKGEPPEIVVTVEDGHVSDAFSRHEDSDTEVPAGDGRLDLYWTIDGLFDKLAAAYARQARVEVEFDPQLGYPLRLYIDDFADFSGEETDYRLTALEPL